jgi:hypothetical protein
LKGEEGKIYLFDDELASGPRDIIDFSTKPMEITECVDCKKGSYCFTITDKNGRKNTFCCQKSKEQEEWIKALTEAGCSFKEDDSLKAVNANSLFEFSATDIHGVVVPLSQFQNQVCLVVNVACQ